MGGEPSYKIMRICISPSALAFFGKRTKDDSFPCCFFFGKRTNFVSFPQPWVKPSCRPFETAVSSVLTLGSLPRLRCKYFQKSQCTHAFNPKALGPQGVGIRFFSIPSLITGSPLIDCKHRDMGVNNDHGAQSLYSICFSRSVGQQRSAWDQLTV